MKHALIIVYLFCFSVISGQNKEDTVKYVNAIKFIQKDKSLSKFRNKYFFKEAKNFKVSEHVIYNYYPLRFVKHLDSLGINERALDSLCAIPKDTVSIIPSAQRLSTNKKSDYTLYFGRPLKSLILVVVQEQTRRDTKYDGLYRRPFIILLVLDEIGNVKKAYCASPIFD